MLDEVKKKQKTILRLEKFLKIFNKLMLYIGVIILVAGLAIIFLNLK